ncbi:MAG: hypothetical protein KY455_07155 [Euryarchaeota archaeon]|nr:hypothetical protein [Euryarchaeota archaeon]
MKRDPDDRYGLATYRKVTLTLALALIVITGLRVLQDKTDGISVYIGAAVVSLVLGLFTEPVYHLIAQVRRRT